MSAPQKTIGSLSLFTILLFLYSLWGRRFHVDEAVLADPTLWLAKDGYLHSEILRGWQFAEEKFLFTHKLYLYVGAVFVKIFGWSAAAVKITSLAFMLGLTALVYRHLKSFGASTTTFVLFFALFLTNAHIFELSFVYRPEIAVAFWAFAVYLMISRYLEKQKAAFLIFAGLFAACAIGFHLNGVIVAGAGGLLLLLNRRWFGAILYGVLGALGFAAHLLGVTSQADFHLLVSQFRNMQDIGTGHFQALHYVINILDEQRRYLHSPREIGLTLFFVPVLIMGWRQIWPKHKNLTLYTLFMATLLALIAHGKDTKYLTILLPCLLLLTTFAFESLQAKKLSWAVGLLALYFASQTYFNGELAFVKEHRSEDYAAISEGITEGSNLLAPVYAVFWGAERFRLQSFISHQFRAAHGHFEMTAEGLAQDLDQNQIDAIIFDQEWEERFHPTEQNLPKFQMVRHDENKKLWYFKRKEATP